MMGTTLSSTVTLALVAAVILLVTGCGGRSTTAELRHRLLAATDVPAAWRVVPPAATAPKASGPCFPPADAKGLTYETVSFVEGGSLPSITEVLASGPQMTRDWTRLERELASCRRAKLALGPTKVETAIRPLSVPLRGAHVFASTWRFTVGGIGFQSDLVFFRTGRFGGYVIYSDLASPRVSAVTAFARAAIAKVMSRTGRTTPVPDDVSIASAPVQTADTRLGAVGYRTIGSGPPLLLVTGYSGTMESWDRRFVDALARDHRVVIFDNAGIGRTDRLAPLSIDAMANETSALISALGLKRVDVVGWSMGTMIAESLAVLHPAQVRRLVLCASYPGDGSVTRPSRAELNAFESGRPKAVLAALFPPGQEAAQNAFLAAASSYPAAAPAPAGIVAAQGRAVDAWWGGTDPAGRRASSIGVPTLVADGTEDRLDPVANSHRVTALIHGARLLLYPAAGHAFLFQDQAAFVPRIEAFLR